MSIIAFLILLSIQQIKETVIYLLKLALLTVMSRTPNSKLGSYSSQVTRSLSLLLIFLIVKNFTSRKVERLVQCTSVYQISSVQFSCSVVSESLQPHEPQHVRPLCPSPVSILNNCSHFATASLSLLPSHTPYTHMYLALNTSCFAEPFESNKAADFTTLLS